MQIMRRPGSLALIVVMCGCVPAVHGHDGSPAPGAALRGAFPVSATNSLSLCQVQNGRGKVVTAGIDSAGGDTLVDRRPASGLYPRISPPYADSAEWFRELKPIEFQGVPLFRNGPPVAALPHEVLAIGEYGGVRLFALAEFRGAEKHEIVLVPLEPGCEFQP